MPEPQPTAREIFDQLIEIESRAERSAALAERCGDDRALRADVESLLDAHDQARSFLETPAVSQAFEGAGSLRSEGVGSQVGPYRLKEQIGEGGFGLVFVAEQQQPVRRLVALKLIKPGMDSREVIARFEAERQALALMDHPHIAKVLDAGTTDSGRPYFVMELVRGLPITDYCDHNSLPTHERMELFVSVCHAVQHAHQKGIIHRDLKPTNVLVTTLDGRSLPKVIDFGVAKAMQQPLTDSSIYTRFHQMLGTPLYMSPEQAEMSSADIDTRSDIYSLGVLLYELITGTTPFDRKRLAQAAFDEIRRIIREEDPPRPSTRLSETGDRLPSIAALRGTEPARLSRLIQGDLDWIVMKALDKDRSRRYSTADNLAMDVERFLHHEPVDAGPPSRFYRARKFMRRNRGPIVTGIALLGLILVGTGMSLWQAIRASRAAKAEREAKAIAEKRLVQLQRGNQLLASVFEDLDPNAEETEGKPLRALLSDRLNQAVAELQGDGIGDPSVTANLQLILGKSLLGLGNEDKAIRLLEAARDSLVRLKGPRDPETLTVLAALGSAYDHVGETSQSLELLETLVRDAETTFGESDLRTLKIRQSLGFSYINAGRLRESARHFDETLRRARQSLGNHHATTLNITMGLARSHRLAGEVDRAIELLEPIAAPVKSAHGPDDPSTILILSELATSYQVARKVEQATSLQTEVIERCRSRFGFEHPTTLAQLNNLGTMYLEAGYLDKAAPVLEDVVRLSRLRYRAGDPRTLAAQSNLAVLYLNSGQAPKAIPLLEDTVQEFRTNRGVDHPSTMMALGNLGAAYLESFSNEKALPYVEEAARLLEQQGFRHEIAAPIILNLTTCYERLGRPADGETWLRKWLPIAKELHGPQSLIYAGALDAIGYNLLLQNRLADAEVYLRDGLAIRKAQAPDGWVTFKVESLLGEALMRQAKFEEAEPRLIAGYEGMVAREASIPAKFRKELAKARRRLLDIYETTGQPEKGLKWKAPPNPSQDRDGQVPFSRKPEPTAREDVNPGE